MRKLCHRIGQINCYLQSVQQKRHIAEYHAPCQGKHFAEVHPEHLICMGTALDFVSSALAKSCASMGLSEFISTKPSCGCEPQMGAKFSITYLFQIILIAMPGSGSHPH